MFSARKMSIPADVPQVDEVPLLVQPRSTWPRDLSIKLEAHFLEPRLHVLDVLQVRLVVPRVVGVARHVDVQQRRRLRRRRVQIAAIQYEPLQPPPASSPA